MNINDFEVYEYLAPNPEKAKHNILFAHANGIPALSYKILFEKMSTQLNLNIFTYDIRGIGKTKIKENTDKKIWSWQTLIDDHVFVFEQLKTKAIGNWVLAGHSLGAWLALLSSEKLKINQVWLFDPPILEPMTVMQWFIVKTIGRADLNPNSKKVLKRKTRFPSYEEALALLKTKSFMKNWSDELILNYLEGSFAQKEDHIALRHNPQWEAHLFEEYPAAAFLGFLRLSLSFRRQFNPLFFVGEKSDTCNPKSKPWVQLFFPRLQWISIQNGTHMFPLELPDQIIAHILKFMHP
ncbi:MAG: alpha/beta hydrolase [Bdellovibrionota bacterium]